jgi:hypothetical protein
MAARETLAEDARRAKNQADFDKNMVLPLESGVKESKRLMVHRVATACLQKLEKNEGRRISWCDTRSSRASIDKARAKAWSRITHIL